MAREDNSILHGLEAEVLKDAGEYVKGKVKDKAIKIGEMSASFLLAFILIMVGIVELIGFYFPVLNNGFNYLLVGFIFLVVGLVIGR